MSSTETDIRKNRNDKTHKQDLSKPLNLQEVMDEDIDVHGEDSCFGTEFDIEHKKCSICADSEVCGIMFHNIQKRTVKRFERDNVPLLDLTDFDGIDYDTLVIWLSSKPRTVDALFDKVQEISKCPDDDTVAYFVRSFIKDSPRLYTQDSIVKIRKG